MSDATTATKVKGFKGFDKNFCCTPDGKVFKFEVGKTYEHEGPVKLCASGFHFVENPLDIFGYYPPAGARFAEVLAEDVSPEREQDTKRVCRRITIVRELSLAEVTAARIAQVDWTKAEKGTASGYRGAATASGYRGAATASGDSGAATASGDSGAATASGGSGAATASGYHGAATASGYRGAATASGDSGAATASDDSGAATASGDSGAATASGYRGAATASGDSGAATASGGSGAATASGEESYAAAVGIYGKARGIKGAWITLAEWKEIKGRWHRIDVKTARVDGKRVKADTFYQLKGGKFVVVAE